MYTLVYAHFFSQGAKAAMMQNNTDMTEAYWGRILCQWCQPVCRVRLSVSQLMEYMMELLRNHFITALQTRFS